MLTCDSNSVYVIWNNTLAVHNLVQLGTCTMQNNGVEAHTVQEAQAQGQLVEVIENSAANLENGEFGRL